MSEFVWGPLSEEFIDDRFRNNWSFIDEAGIDMESLGLTIGDLYTEKEYKAIQKAFVDSLYNYYSAHDNDYDLECSAQAFVSVYHGDDLKFMLERFLKVGGIDLYSVDGYEYDDELIENFPTIKKYLGKEAC